MTPLIMLLATALSTAQAQDTIDPVPSQVSTEHYELNLRLDYEQQVLAGTARLTLRNSSNRPATNVPLLLYRLMEVTAARDASGHPLTFDQDVVRFNDFDQLQVTAVQIRLPAALQPGQSTTIAVDYTGRLLGYAETGMRYVQDRIDPSFTIIRNDGFAFPAVGVPSIQAIRSAPLESYDYVARITVPDSLFVANGGQLVETRQTDGARTFVYRSLRPSWRMDFAIGHYGQLEYGPLRVLYLREDSIGARNVARAAEACMKLYTEWFGPLQNTPVLTFLEIPDGWGSQKDVTTIIQTAAAFRDSTRFHEVYHELAHLWQPEITDQPPPRWNEGLASFLEMLADENLSGKPAVDRHADRLIAWLRDGAASHPRWRAVPMIDYGKENLTDLSYTVGAIFFDLLYRTAGPTAFNQSLKAYYQTFAGAGGSTAELQAAFADHSPVDLAPIFRDWLYTTRWYDALTDVASIGELARRYAGPRAAGKR